MDALAGIIPLMLLVVYIGVPVSIIYFFYKKYENLALARNNELRKQREALERIASVLERST